DPVLEEFETVLARIELKAPSIPFVSNVTGRWITPEQARSPRYWVDHLPHTVRFADGIAELLGAADLFIEVGPGETLSGLARRHPDMVQKHFIRSSQCSPARQQLN